MCRSVALPHAFAIRWFPRAVFLSDQCTNLQVFLKDNASLLKDCDVTMEIPVDTAIAFALTELEIRHNGHFGESDKDRGVFISARILWFMRRAPPSAELCLMSDTKGGFEVDGPPQTKPVGVAGPPANNPLRQGKGLLAFPVFARRDQIVILSYRIFWVIGRSGV